MSFSVRVLLTLAGAALFAWAPKPSFAQFTCAHPYGNCPITAGTPVPGGPCFCMTPTGPIQGMTQLPNAVIAPASTFPQFCCTPAGRLGPYFNTTIAAGQFCQVPTPTGMIPGQACY